MWPILYTTDFSPDGSKPGPQTSLRCTWRHHVCLRIERSTFSSPPLAERADFAGLQQLRSRINTTAFASISAAIFVVSRVHDVVVPRELSRHRRAFLHGPNASIGSSNAPCTRLCSALPLLCLPLKKSNLSQPEWRILMRASWSSDLLALPRVRLRRPSDCHVTEDRKATRFWAFFRKTTRIGCCAQRS